MIIAKYDEWIGARSSCPPMAIACAGFVDVGAAVEGDGVGAGVGEVVGAGVAH